MQGSFTRRQFLKTGSFFGLGALLGLGSCENLAPPVPSQPQLIFHQLDASCASNREAVLLLGDRKKITFSGAVQTPTLCYDLQAELITMRCAPKARCPNTYEIAIATKAQDVICVKCIGMVRYRGEIRGLAAGMYTIAVTHDGRHITSERVQVGK